MINKKIKSIFVMAILFATLFFVFTPNVTAGDFSTGNTLTYALNGDTVDFRTVAINSTGFITVSSAESSLRSWLEVIHMYSVDGTTITLEGNLTIGDSIGENGADVVKYNNTAFFYATDDNKIYVVDLTGYSMAETIKTGWGAGSNSIIYDMQLTNSSGGLAIIYADGTGNDAQDDIFVVAGTYAANDFTWGTPVKLNDSFEFDYSAGPGLFGGLAKLDDNEMAASYQTTNFTAIAGSARDINITIFTISGNTITVVDTESLAVGDTATSPKRHQSTLKRINNTHCMLVFRNASGGYSHPAIKVYEINATHEIEGSGLVTELSTSWQATCGNAVLMDASTIYAIVGLDTTVLRFSSYTLADRNLTQSVAPISISGTIYSDAISFEIIKLDTGIIAIQYGEQEGTNTQSAFAGEYIANAYPVQSNPDPDDEATDIEATPMLNITVNDAEGDSMTLHWLSNSSGSWVEFGSNSSVGNGTYHQTNSNFSGSLTKYWWSVNVTDGNWTNATYSFTTIEVSANSNPFPADNAEDVALEPTIHITVNDTEGDTMNVTFRTNATAETWGDIATNSSVPNGTYYQDSVPFNSYSTKYWWSVNTTDGTNWYNNTYCFTTKDNAAPTNSNPVPANAATGTDQNPTLYINVSDPESENMDVHWWTNATGSWINFHTDSAVGNTTQNAVTTNMDTLDTKYWWSVNTTDGTNWDNDTYYFTTTATSPNPVNSNPVPANAATNQPLNFNVFNITCNDPNGDTMDISLWTNNTDGGNWVKWKYVNGVSNGTNSWVGSHDPYFTDLDGNTKYYWSVNTTDGTNWDNDTYYFTTNHTYSMTITKTANVSTVAATDTVWDTQLVNYTINVTNTGTGELTDININETWWNCSCSDWKFWFISTNEPNWETNLTIYNDSCYMSINITNISAGESYELYILLNISECAIDTEGTLRNWANVTATYAPAKTSYCDITWGSPPAAKGLAITVADILMVFILVVVIFAILGTLIVLMGKIKF